MDLHSLSFLLARYRIVFTRWLHDHPSMCQQCPHFSLYPRPLCSNPDPDIQGPNNGRFKYKLLQDEFLIFLLPMHFIIYPFVLPGSHLWRLSLHPPHLYIGDALLTKKRYTSLLSELSVLSECLSLPDSTKWCCLQGPHCVEFSKCPFHAFSSSGCAPISQKR